MADSVSNMATIGMADVIIIAVFTTIQTIGIHLAHAAQKTNILNDHRFCKYRELQ